MHISGEEMGVENGISSQDILTMQHKETEDEEEETDEVNEHAIETDDTSDSSIQTVGRGKKSKQAKKTPRRVKRENQSQQSMDTSQKGTENPCIMFTGNRQLLKYAHCFSTANLCLLFCFCLFLQALMERPLSQKFLVWEDPSQVILTSVPTW